MWHSAAARSHAWIMWNRMWWRQQARDVNATVWVLPAKNLAWRPCYRKQCLFFRKTAECTLYNHFLSELKSEDTRDEVDPYA